MFKLEDLNAAMLEKQLKQELRNYKEYRALYKKHVNRDYIPAERHDSPNASLNYKVSLINRIKYYSNENTSLRDILSKLKIINIIVD